jgi:hypothetical protein
LIFTDPTGNTRLPVAKERRDGGWGGFGVVASGMAFVKYGAANTFAQMGMHDAGPEFSHYSTWSENSEINSLFPSYASFEKVIQSTGGITIGRMTGVLGNYIAMEVNAAGTQTLTNSRDMYLTYEEIWIPTPINKTSDQKDDYSWAKNTQTDLGAFDVGNGAKGGLIDYAVASSAGKSMNALKRADYVATLGKTGANYVRAFKVVGVATFGASTVISASLATNYYMNGGLDYSVGIKSSVDIVMGVVGFLGPVGFGISATYFIIDAASDGFGGYGDPLKINN